MPGRNVRVYNRPLSGRVSLTVLFACVPLWIYGGVAWAEGGLRSESSCMLDADDSEAVQQAKAFASAVCSSAEAGIDSQACLDAQEQWRESRQDACPVAACTLRISRIAVVRNRIEARSIDDFMAQAAETSASGGGEVGSFRWTLNEERTGYANRAVTLVAGGVMTVPDADLDGGPVADQALILKAARMIAAHEARHRDAFLKVARRACTEMTSHAADTDAIFQRYFCGTGPGSNAAAQHEVDLVDGITGLVLADDGKKTLVSRGADYDPATYITSGLCNQD